MKKIFSAILMLFISLTFVFLFNHNKAYANVGVWENVKDDGYYYFDFGGCSIQGICSIPQFTLGGIGIYPPSETEVELSYGPDYDEMGPWEPLQWKSVYHFYDMGGVYEFVDSEIREIPSTYSISIRYKSNIPDQVPVLNGETAFVTNVSNPMPLTEIKSHITAHDNEDGDVTHLIELVSDNYTPNMNNIGTWVVEYSVTDSANNTATLRVNVLVKDIDEPIITGQNTYNVSYTTELNVTDITNALSITDNYDSSLDIIIETNNYTPNFDKVGQYTINYKSTDGSNNIGTYTVTVNVIDDVKPVFSGPTTIVKPQGDILTSNDVLSQLTANDIVDGNLTSSIQIVEDTYSGNGEKVGQYTITFSVSDSSGNTETRIVTIDVKDNIPPCFLCR